MRRLFLAINFDDDFRGAIGRYAMDLRGLFSPMRPSWVDPGLFHITLHFFGELDDSGASAIAAGFASLPGKLAAPRLSVESLDFLPSRRRPRVLCLKIATEPAGAMEGIVSEARRLAVSLGAASETKPWRAHITIARFRDPFAALPASPPKPPPLSTVPDSFCLMESFLSPQKPRYEIVERFRYATIERA